MNDEGYLESEVMISFDLVRMKDAVKSPHVMIPDDLSDDNLDKFLMREISDEHEPIIVGGSMAITNTEIVGP